MGELLVQTSCSGGLLSAWKTRVETRGLDYGGNHIPERLFNSF